MDARLVASRMPGLAMYGTPYTGQPFPGYLPYASPADPSTFYNTMPAGENAEAWRAGLTQAAAAAYYEPQLAAHYGYGYGPMGLADGARRKNATRETTSTLKAWLNEHRKNPYPTKGEKIMLAIITKMTLTQVSTWFANARRRLKKENKMTWSPRNRCGEDDDDDIMDDDNNCDVNNANNNNHNHSGSENSAKNGETSGNSRSSSPAPSGSERIPFGVGPHVHNPFMMAHKDGENNAMKHEDEEIDLESLDEDKKDIIMGKVSDDLRRQSNEFSLHLQRQQLTSPKSSSALLQNRIPIPHHRQMPPGSRFSLPSHLMGAHPVSKPNMTQFSSSNADRTSKIASPTSSTASNPSSMSSPTKPKIWSLADVATSSDVPKNRGCSPTSSNNPGPNSPPMMQRPPGMVPNPAFQQEAIRNWVDGVMQQQKQMAMAAAAMAGAHPHAFLPNGGAMMPPNFAAALNPAALAALSRGNGEQPENKRFHPYGFADFAAAQQRATLAAAQAAGMSMHNSKPESPPAIFTSSKIHSPDCARIEQISSPTASDRVSPPRQIENTILPTSRPSSNDSGIASAEASKDIKHK